MKALEGKMETLKECLRLIEAVSDKTGRVFSFLFIPLMIISFAEFSLRYMFNSPTIWAWDINIQLFGLLIIFGGVYTYCNNMHVRVDLVIIHFSKRWQAIMDILSSSLFFFSFSVLLILSLQEAWHSFSIRELASSIWAPPVYPLKMMIPLAILLFLLQGVAHLIRDVLVIMCPEGERQ